MAEEKTEEQKPKEAEVAAGDDKNATTIHLKVYSPYQVYFDDEATSVSAENDTGPFDVLPRHHNFITLLNPCEVDIKASSGNKKIRISRGVMHVRKNQVTIFLDV